MVQGNMHFQPSSTEGITVPVDMTKGLSVNGTRAAAPTVILSGSTAPVGSTTVAAETIYCPDIKNHLVFNLFGAGSNNNTFDWYVYGWKYSKASGKWLARAAFKVTCSLANATGASGGDLVGTDRPVDVFTVPTEDAPVVIYDAPNNGLATIVLDMLGDRHATMYGDIDTATNHNVMWGTL